MAAIGQLKLVRLTCSAFEPHSLVGFLVAAIALSVVEASGPEPKHGLGLWAFLEGSNERQRSILLVLGVVKSNLMSKAGFAHVVHDVH